MRNKIKNLFKVNKYISVALLDGRVNILVNGEKFIVCKAVAIRISARELYKDRKSFSIDDLINKNYNKIEEGGKINESASQISLETEFLVHCSNLQAWAENGYDSRLLHYSLAFPLLKRLYELGDLQAIRIFKEEIVKRYLEGNKWVQEFLTIEEYLKILTLEERQLLFKKNLIEIQEIEKLTGRTLEIKADILYNSGVELLDGKVIGLCLYGERKMAIPHTISLIKSLKRLILKHFINKELPEWIGKLSNLEYLDVSDNKLEKIPKSLGKLYNLKYLNLGYNNLKNLPETVVNLRKLKRIKLSENRFEKFPKELLSLEGIEVINLFGNNIISVPPEIQQLRSLYELNIINNPTKSLPDELFLLPVIEYILLPKEGITIQENIKEKIKKRKVPLNIYPIRLINQ